MPDTSAPGPAVRPAGWTLSIVGVLLAVAGCGQDAGDAAGEPIESDAAPTTPGEPATAWQPRTPRQAVDSRAVERDYTDVLDAVVAASGDELSWSAARVTTEEFGGVCAVKLERVATGALAPDVDGLQRSLAAAVEDRGFPDLAVANDPGGALVLVAHDAHDALLELRSKGGTTAAVRVATIGAECGETR